MKKFLLIFLISIFLDFHTVFSVESDIVLESNNSLEEELKEFFYKEFVLPDINISNKTISDQLKNYDEYCEQLAEAAILVDTTYHRPSLSLRLIFKKNREEAKNILKKILILEKNKSNNWVYLAANLESIKLEIYTTKISSYSNKLPEKFLKSLIELRDQNSNLKVKLEASKLLVRLFFDQINLEKLAQELLISLDFLTNCKKILDMEFELYINKYLVVSKQIPEANVFLRKYLERQEKALKELEYEDFKLPIVPSKDTSERTSLNRKSNRNICCCDII